MFHAAVSAGVTITAEDDPPDEELLLDAAAEEDEATAAALLEDAAMEDATLEDDTAAVLADELIPKLLAEALEGDREDESITDDETRPSEEDN